jgi:antitoxin ParD1/3/4
MRQRGVATAAIMSIIVRMNLLCSRRAISFNAIGRRVQMPSSYTLGKHFETFVQAQLASGRYNNASEVVRDALRLMEERERRLAALDAALVRGIADADAGRVTPAEAVLDRLEAKYTRMVAERETP